MEGSCKVIDVTGEICPVPLVKTRRGLEKLGENEVLVVMGNSVESEKEIIMVVKELEMELINIEMDEDGRWRISIRKR